MKKIVYTIITVMILMAIILSGVYIHIERFGEQSRPEQAEVIIVLGAAVWRGGPSPALLERISLAEDLYRQEYAPAIITTGGSGKINPMPEGRAAKQELIARGIPEAVIYEEIYSENTKANLAGASVLMQEHGWQRAIIVSHDFHLLRAVREGHRLGLEVSGAGVHKTAMVRLPMVLREVAANLVSMVGI